ncbi:MAG: TIGR02597 family protein [Verrucomicrobiales bacterium]|nr:TIGR02597 family protein [Verrucomicrobiales bacterium]
MRRTFLLLPLLSAALAPTIQAQLGVETSLPYRLQDGQEYQTSMIELLHYGQLVFDAPWRIDEGGGRPLTKGTGPQISDPSSPLVFPRNFNRISAPDSNSCVGCHNSPVSGGNGDIVANVFVLGQRFDFATFDHSDSISTRGGTDEEGKHPTLQQIANSRATLGMFGSGYIEMLAREMTVDLQAIRDSMPPSSTMPLESKGVSFGMLSRNSDGSWDVSQVEGLPLPSLSTTAPKPNLIVRPFHQVGNVVSLRQFSNNAFNHHHGMQSTERFGEGADVDGDGKANEMNRADITAVSLYQAAMAVPGRVIPNNATIQSAVLNGENHFVTIGCAQCHTPSLPLSNTGHLYSEPNPFNPPGNLTPDDMTPITLDLNSDPSLPQPRLRADSSGITHVPAFTDLKLHDITSGPGDPNVEALNQNAPAGSPAFFAGNSLFLTRKLWGLASKPNFFHHGMYTTIKEAILAHAGESEASRQAYQALSPEEQAELIEFLKSLRNLPEGSPSTVLDTSNMPRAWPPHQVTSVSSSGGNLEVAWQGGTEISPRTADYELELSTDLVSWTSAGPATTDTSALLPMNLDRAFYRVRLSDDSQPPTDPIGYVKTTIPASGEAVVAPCLQPEMVYQDKILSISGSSVTVAMAPGWSPNQFVHQSGSQPVTYAAVVVTGESAGIMGLISANTDHSLTVLFHPNDNLSGIATVATHGLASADQIAIIPYWTPDTLVGTNLPQGSQILLFRSTNAGTDLSASTILELDGGSWYDAATFQPAGDTAIGFHEAFIVRNPSTAETGFTAFGRVPRIPQHMILRTLADNVAQDIRVGYLCPVPEPIGAISLNLRTDDQLLVYDNSATGINKAPNKILIYEEGTGWIDGDTFEVVNDTFQLTPGVGYTLRLKGSSPTYTGIWHDLPGFIAP